MNKENAHLYLPLVQAMVDGKTIQSICDMGMATWWNDFKDGEDIKFCQKPEYYRIKPEPRTFEVFYHKKTDTVVKVKEYTELGSLPDWERITVQEVLK